MKSLANFTDTWAVKMTGQRSCKLLCGVAVGKRMYQVCLCWVFRTKRVMGDFFAAQDEKKGQESRISNNIPWRD